MKIIFRIFILVCIFLGWLYFLYPSLFYPQKSYNNDINISQYILTPKPSQFFLLNLRISSSSIYNTKSIEWWAKSYFDAVNLFQTNIIWLLSNSNSKNITLKTYIAQLENLQSQLSDIITNLQNTNTQYELNLQNYLSKKQEWDTEFTNGFLEKDVEMIWNWLKQSYINWPKYIKYRILSNANKIIINKLNFIKTLVDNKLLLLQENSSDIVNNFELIKWDMLIKLLSLKKQLENNQFN